MTKAASKKLNWQNHSCKESWISEYSAEIGGGEIWIFREESQHGIGTTVVWEAEFRADLDAAEAGLEDFEIDMSEANTGKRLHNSGWKACSVAVAKRVAAAYAIEKLAQKEG